MFRITQFMQELARPTPPGPRRAPPGPVVIWNLVRRCNLTCKHCYSISADRDFAGELDTGEVFRVMDDLKAAQVPVLILSGGEPLLRPDLFDIARRAKAMGFYLGLSSNGTLVDAAMAARIAAAGFDYVGISLDGLGATHDRFRRKEGAYAAALAGVRLCRDAGAKVGIRFTLTQDNAQDLPALLDLMEAERIDKFYLSHLNYAGRGNKNRKDDAHFRTTREAMECLFERCWQQVSAGRACEYVSGNNDADGVFLLRWAQARFPERAAHLRGKLAQWGGNASGVNVANIDNLGQVHPDTMWWDYPLGNVRERPFAHIWNDLADPLMAGLKQSPRPLKGRCAACAQRDICNGNTRVRAWHLHGDFWAEDPGCYLTDEEIGLAAPGTPAPRGHGDARDSEARPVRVMPPVSATHFFENKAIPLAYATLSPPPVGEGKGVNVIEDGRVAPERRPDGRPPLPASPPSPHGGGVGDDWTFRILTTSLMP